MIGISELPVFRITERDVAILRAIARYRFLTAELVHRIVGGSERGVRNRLRNLGALAYLVRLQGLVTEPCAYGLGNRGARLLSDCGVEINDKLDWAAKNDTTRHFLAHTLAVAEAMLHFQAAAEIDALCLTDHDDLLRDMPEPTRMARYPFCMRVTVRLGAEVMSIPAVPDRLFSLRYHDGTRHNFALELDRGTMDIWANRLAHKSSFRRKLIAYCSARQEKRHTQLWGFNSFRVLTVTTGEERIRNMIEAQRRVAPECPPGFFLYSTMERLTRHGALGPAWVTTKGDHVSLRHDGHARVAELVTPMSADDTAPSLRAAGVKRRSTGTTRALA